MRGYEAVNLNYDVVHDLAHVSIDVLAGGGQPVVRQQLPGAHLALLHVL